MQRVGPVLADKVESRSPMTNLAAMNTYRLGSFESLVRGMTYASTSCYCFHRHLPSLRVRRLSDGASSETLLLREQASRRTSPLVPRSHYALKMHVR
jgi:hypothetical protein